MIIRMMTIPTEAPTAIPAIAPVERGALFPFAAFVTARLFWAADVAEVLAILGGAIVGGAIVGGITTAVVKTTLHEGAIFACFVGFTVDPRTAEGAFFHLLKKTTLLFTCCGGEKVKIIIGNTIWNW